MPEPRITKWKKFTHWIRDNERVLSVLLNTCVILLTLITILVTSIFSYLSLEESRKQFKLSNDQFISSLHQKTIDSAQRINDKREADIQRSHDTIIANARYNQQQKRNSFQDSINNEQLHTIQYQSKLASLQYKQQLNKDRQHFFEERPMFLILDAVYDTVGNTGTIKIINRGKRGVKVTSTKVICYNPSLKVYDYYVEQNINMEVNGEISLGFTFKVSKLVFEKSNTGFYLAINYTDDTNGKEHHFEKFFLWNKTNNYIKWADLNPFSEAIFKNHAIKQGFKF